MDMRRNIISTTLMPVEQTQYTILGGYQNVFGGALVASNTDTTFSEITTGDSYEISEITAADPGVITFAGGAELVTNPDVEAALPTMNGVSFTTFRCALSQSTTQKHADTYSIKMLGNAASSSMSVYFADGSNCGLVSGIKYEMSVWVYIPSGQGISITELLYRNNAGTSVSLDETTTTDSWVQLSGVFEDDDVQRVFYLRSIATDTDTLVVYWDDFTAKSHHDYNTTTNSVISIGGVESEALGAELVTNGNMETGDPPTGWTAQGGATLSSVADERTGGSGAASMNAVRGSLGTIAQRGATTVVDSWYEVSGWVKNVDATDAHLSVFGTNMGTLYTEVSASTSWVYVSMVFQAEDTFVAVEPRVTGSVGEQGRFDGVSMAEVIPVLAKPYRIDSISATGVVTLLNADFSDLAAAITSGYTTSATLTNWTEGDGWMPGLDLDPTPINSGTLTLGEVYYVTLLGTPDTFGVGVLLYDFFTSAGTETADATNTVVHLTDTYAVCDGSQVATTDLVNTEVTPTAKTGYKITKIYESIDVGGSTTYIGERPSVERTIAATYEENIKTTNTTGATERGTSDLECKITSYTIEEYGG